MDSDYPFHQPVMLAGTPVTLGARELERRVREGELTEEDILAANREFVNDVKTKKTFSEQDLLWHIQEGADVSGEWMGHPGHIILTAAEHNKAQMIRLLVKIGVDVHVLDEHDNNALFHAVDHQCYDAAKALVEAGVDMLHLGLQGYSPATRTVSKGNETIMRLFLANGLNPEHYLPEQGTTLFQYTLHRSRSKFLSDMVEFGANPEQFVQYTSIGINISAPILAIALHEGEGALEWHLINAGVNLHHLPGKLLVNSVAFSQSYENGLKESIAYHKRIAESEWQAWSAKPELTCDARPLRRFANIGKLENYFLHPNFRGQEKALITQIDALTPPFLQQRMSTARASLVTRLKPRHQICDAALEVPQHREHAR